MAELTREEKTALLKLARSAITSCLITDNPITRPESPTPAMTQKRGCFVSLHRRGQLRGCIGTIEPSDALVSGIEENAKSAAFRDPRFSPLKKEELDGLDIEISILSEPKALRFSDEKDLKRQLVPHLHGVILSTGGRRATFLPQVWSQLPEKERFLEHLCRKAGWEPDCWKSTQTQISVYEVEYFSE